MKRTEVYSLIKSGRYADAIALLSSAVAEPTPLTTPQAAFQALKPHWRATTESFFVITLNGANDLISTHCVTTGLVNRTLVHPREVFRPAILDNAVSIIVAHNHPSGRLDPSPEDISLTQRLQDVASIIGISLLDHLIFGTRRGQASFISLKELGYIS
jgi:DNA repair protein RadC